MEVIKSILNSVKCDKLGKLITVDNCLKCDFYKGEIDGFIDCEFDKLKYRSELEKQYKKFCEQGIIEFGSDKE